jgi:phospholipid/cholesterol/gamma-HCH transport system ATP-binding protein
MPKNNGQSETKKPIIRLIDVRKSFGELHVLRGVSLSFNPGQTTVVLGPSGEGKSVMLKHIVGLLRPDAGEVWFEDTRVDTLSEQKLGPVRRQIGFLFQQSALFDSMTVGENIAFPIKQLTQLTAKQTEQRVDEVLSLVGLSGSQPKMPAELSGGQRKRVALARAIVLKPKVVLYDEPTTGLDPIRADVINELILKLQRELNVTSIAVTHDLASAFKIADTMVMLYRGSVLLQDTPERMRQSTDPVVCSFLAGEAGPEELAGIVNRGRRDKISEAQNR